jgi:hypothetical protein
MFVTVIAVAVGLLVALSSSNASGLPRCAATEQSPVLPAPSRFADSGGSELRPVIELRSAATGRVLRVIARYGFNNFTNNGIAYSPDGRYVYVTLIPRGRGQNLQIERITVATGAQRMVASGWGPSLSPDGRLLAYLSFGHRVQEVVVMNLVTGRTQQINLEPRLGANEVLSESPPAWLGDGRGLVVTSGPPFVATVPRSTRRGASHAVPPRFALITIAVSVAGLHAGFNWTTHQLDLAPVSAGPGDDTVMGTGVTSIGEITFTGAEPRLCRLATIPDGLILGFDPTGLRVIFLKGHTPPVPFEATISRGELINAHRLTGWGTGALAW